MKSRTVVHMHNHILTPPVSSCINEECGAEQKSGSLSVVRKPVAVTVFDVDGGRQGAKVSLNRVRPCGHTDLWRPSA